MPDLTPYAKDGNTGKITWQPVRSGADAKPGRYRFEVYGTGGQASALLELIDPFGRHVKVRHDGELQAVRFHDGRPLFTERNTHFTLTADPGYQITTDVVHGDEWYVDYNPDNERAAGWLGTFPKPARCDWIPDAVKDLVLADNSLLPSYARGRVYVEQERPEEGRGFAEPKPPWARIIVLLPRETAAPMPTSTIGPTGQRTVDVCIYFEVASDPERGEGWDYLTACEDLHDVVHGAISGMRLHDPKDRHKIVFPLYRTKESAPPWRDDDAGTWVMEAEYRTVIQRIA